MRNGKAKLGEKEKRWKEVEAIEKQVYCIERKSETEGVESRSKESKGRGN